MGRGELSAGLLFLLALVWGCADAGGFVDWAAGNLVVVENLDGPLPDEPAHFLQEAIGPARLVGLGESRHDIREQTLLKSTLVRSLIEDQGFRCLILEESFVHAESIDRYVTTGIGDPRRILNDLAGWYLWDTEEMLAHIEWIRRHNADLEAGAMVRVFGMDVTAPAPGIREVLKQLRAIDAAAGLDEATLGLDLHDGDFWPAIWQRYSELSTERRRGLTSAYDQLVAAVEAAHERLVSAGSENEYQRLLLLAVIGRSGNAVFSAADREAGGVFREQGMAATVGWILDHPLQGEKAVVWAHNLHVGKSPFRMPAMGESAFEPMGMLLDATYGDAYVAVGAAFGTGSFSADLPPGERRFELPDDTVMDGALARAGGPTFLLDLRSVDAGSAAAVWLQQERGWTAQDADVTLVPAGAFDLVFFVREVSRAQPTPLALERFRSW